MCTDLDKCGNRSKSDEWTKGNIYVFILKEKLVFGEFKVEESGLSTQLAKIVLTLWLNFPNSSHLKIGFNHIGDISDVLPSPMFYWLWEFLGDTNLFCKKEIYIFFCKN